MLVTQFLDDRRSRGGNIPQDATEAGHFEKVIDDLAGKAIRIRGKLRIDDKTGQFPVAGRAVFSARLFGHLAVARARGCRRRDSLNCRDVSKPECPEVRKPYPSDRPRRIHEGVASFIAVPKRVWKLSDPDAIKNNENDFPRGSFALQCCSVPCLCVRRAGGIVQRLGVDILLVAFADLNVPFIELPGLR